MTNTVSNGFNSPGFAESLHRALASHDFPFRVEAFDTEELLSRKTDYYTFDDHLNASGHRKIAEKLSLVLKADAASH